METSGGLEVKCGQIRPILGPQDLSPLETKGFLKLHLWADNTVSVVVHISRIKKKVIVQKEDFSNPQFGPVIKYMINR